MRSLPSHPDAQSRSSDAERSRGCDGCSGDASSDRRRFLRDALTALGATLATVGLRGSELDAMPWRSVSAHDARGAVRRYPIPTVDGVEIDRESEVILVRWQQAVYAFNLACPHQNVALRWIEGDRRFQCPKHKSKYEADGTFISGRATRGLDRFTITREGTTVVVDLDALHKQDADPSAWSAVLVRLA